MIDDVKGWMVSLGLALATAIGWGYRETQINKQQAKTLEEHGVRIGKLEEKSAERGIVMARIDERQASMASDLKDIKRLLEK